MSAEVIEGDRAVWEAHRWYDHASFPGWILTHDMGDLLCRQSWRTHRQGVAGEIGSVNYDQQGAKWTLLRAYLIELGMPHGSDDLPRSTASVDWEVWVKKRLPVYEHKRAVYRKVATGPGPIELLLVDPPSLVPVEAAATCLRAWCAVVREAEKRGWTVRKTSLTLNPWRQFLSSDEP